MLRLIDLTFFSKQNHNIVLSLFTSQINHVFIDGQNSLHFDFKTS